jgi:hypothetical protein
VLSGFSLTKPTLVHADLGILTCFYISQFDCQLTRIGLQNILFDQKSNRHTAILDFNFAHVASAAGEDFSSFPSIHGLLMGSLESEEMETLRQAMLNGFAASTFTPLKGSQLGTREDVI